MDASPGSSRSATSTLVSFVFRETWPRRPAPAVETLARAEGLVGHWRAVEVRVTKAKAAARPAAKAKRKPARRPRR